MGADAALKGRSSTVAQRAEQKAAKRVGHLLKSAWEAE